MIVRADARHIPLRDGSADLVLTDPPYEAEAHTLQRRVKRGGGVMAIEALPFDALTEELRALAAVEMARIARRWVLTFCQVEAAPIWRRAYERAGLVYKRTMIWVKPDGMPQYSGDRPGMGYETILAMHVPGRSYWNGGGRHGVFIVPKSNGSGPNLHPTEKPRLLMMMLVELFSNCGELIVDPFCGSGSTGWAAEKQGRRHIGLELSAEYAAIARKRTAQMGLWT